MPAKDTYHDAVVEALEKDGWAITGEQIYVVVEGRHYFLDLAAQHRDHGGAIVVEVKSFVGDISPMDMVSVAVGKYMLYRIILAAIGDIRPLYLSVPIQTYNGVLSEQISAALLKEARVSLMVFDPSSEEVVEWINEL